MPYTPEHKAASRKKILESARALFSTKGYQAVTVDQVMENCAMTRGAFYAHFNSKAELYTEALMFAATNSELARAKPQTLSSRAWLGQLLDRYLSMEHVMGEKPCPLAFLVTDIAARDSKAKQTYARTFANMNKAMLSYLGKNSSCTKQTMLSVTALIIGGVAVARSIDDRKLVKQILDSCREQAKILLGGI
jgi:TetR/AcrR family transcriptional regulator, transcriptional repressor for nem operon